MTSVVQHSDSLSYDLLLRKSCAHDECARDDDVSTAEPDWHSCASSSEEEEAHAIPAKDRVQLIRNVAIHGAQGDPRVEALIRAARELSLKAFDEDCLKEVTKKSGWKLALLATSDLSTLCGFIVAKVAKGALSVAKLAVPAEFRGSGFGRLIMDEVIKSARKQGDAYEVCLSSLAEAVRFYQRLGFKAFPGLKLGDGSDDLVEGQVYMEKKLRPRRK
jgi:ribosomal protein S18 acetylase RimI-like enzyme